MFLSIITVTKDNLSGLQATATSIAAQSSNKYEWIAIDGASNDGTQNYLKTTDTNWISEKDSGIYHAMNKGIERANGDYLLFLNAGDIFTAPDVIERLYVSNNNADFLYGDALESMQYKKARSHNVAALGMFTHHQAMIYRRNTVGDLRYNTSYKIAADYDFTLQFLRECRDISYLPFPICDFEQGGISQTRAEEGRHEQFQIRKRLHISNIIENAAIYVTQTVLWNLRIFFPRLYWYIKKNL